MTRKQTDLVSIAQTVMRNRYPDLDGGWRIVYAEIVNEIALLVQATDEDRFVARCELIMRYGGRSDEMAEFDAGMEADEG